MYRFRKENWVRKVDGSYPKHWSKSSREYGFFMEQPSHMAESQYMETHSDRVKRNPYVAPTVPRARMSVADRVPRRSLRRYRKRVGVHYDYDNGNDMWDVLRHRENPRRPLPRSLSPVARRPTMKGGSSGAEDAPLVENPWYPMLRTNTAVGRGFGRVAHSRMGYEANDSLRDEWVGDVSQGTIDGQHGHATDYNRAKTPRVPARNGLHGDQMGPGTFRNELKREPTRMNLLEREPTRMNLLKREPTGVNLFKREPTGVNLNGNTGHPTDYSRANTPGLPREYTMGPRLHTFGPREYHGLPEPSRPGTKRPVGPLGGRQDTAIRRGRSLSPVGNRKYSAATSRFLEGSRIGSPVPRSRKQTLNEKFFRFNFHEPWKPSIRT